MADSTQIDSKSVTQDFFIGELHISAESENLIATLTQNISKEYLKIFHPKDDNGKELEFKIDDAREVIAQSHMASAQTKTLILCAPKYRIEAQNALLKILEEPPIKTKFILIAPSKNAILPTIISRLRTTIHKDSKKLPDFELNVNNLSLAVIYEFLQQCDKQNKSVYEVKEHIQSLLFALHAARIRLKERDLKAFDNAIKQADSFVKESYIFLPLLLRVRTLTSARKKL